MVEFDTKVSFPVPNKIRSVSLMSKSLMLA